MNLALLLVLFTLLGGLGGYALGMVDGLDQGALKAREQAEFETWMARYEAAEREFRGEPRYQVISGGKRR